MSTSPAKNGHGSTASPPAAPPVPPADRAAALVVLRLAAGHHVSARARRLALASDRWRDLIESTQDTALPHRANWIAAWPALHAARVVSVDDLAIITRAMEQAQLDLKVHPDDPDPDELAAPKPFDLGVLGSAAFAGRRFVREWLISRLLVRGQPTIVGGPRKGMKTSLIIDLAVSLASQTPFLGQFSIPRAVKTLVVSGESGDATIQETARRICTARGLDLADLEGWAFWGFSLPQLSRPEHMDALASFISETGIEVVMIDPLYLCLLSGNAKLDAANLFDVGPLLKQVSDVCLSAGATPILVHHLRKNREDPHSPPELEDLAFAGVQEFARQWVMIGRRETYVPGTGEHALWLAVGGSAGHSGAWAVDIHEGVIGEDFGEREWRVEVTTATEARQAVADEVRDAKAAKAAERRVSDDAVKSQRLADDAAHALAKLEKLGTATRTAWRDALGTWDSKRFGPAVAWLDEAGRIEVAEIEVASGKGHKTVKGFRPVPRPPTANPDEPG